MLEEASKTHPSFLPCLHLLFYKGLYIIYRCSNAIHELFFVVVLGGFNDFQVRAVTQLNSKGRKSHFVFLGLKVDHASSFFYVSQPYTRG